jgi:hypothetical protein
METARVPEIEVSDDGLDASVIQTDVCNESSISLVSEWRRFTFPGKTASSGDWYLIGLMCGV